MKIKEILAAIENVAPLAFQEDFDNSGVQIGNTNQELTAVLLCIDITEPVIEEAIALGCNLIISHHPLAFHPFKSITGRNYIERCMMKACKHDIIIYAAHTNIDNARYGINNHLATKLNLQNIRILQPKQGQMLKLVTFVPNSHIDIIRNALFNAGAGNTNNYDMCSYTSFGEGSFRAGTRANPYCGNIGQQHFESEIRLEVVLPLYKKNEIIQALLAVHPYEEPAYDFYLLQNDSPIAGSGVVGTLPEAMDEEDFLYYLKDTLNASSISFSAYRHEPVRDVAICSGSGAFLIPQAISYGADVFVTGEARYNDFYNVEDKLLLAVIGHYESEIFTKNVFFDIISKKYPNFALHLSRVDINPVNYL